MRFFPLLASLPLFLLLGCTTTRYAAKSTAYAERPAQATRERMIVYEASLSLRSDEPDSTLANLLDRMEAAGGYFVRKDDYGLTMRLPAAELLPFMDQLETLGKVTDRNVSTTDVTDEYADYGIRLGNTEAARDRYLELLGRAETVEETLLVEKELERLREEIELLKGRRARLDTQTAYSLLRVDVAERVRPGPLGYVFKGLYEGVKWLFVRD